ncbi:pLS20_p028 family conjugation system transmembrane protein [Halobacillus amylolyticus]|uniref:DUF8208 domain-containing protein n=1 Tax=Halobacillus amylolyticus TaxID=2932259 RepID=A0ABY4H8K6_9BACI|nr:hypothetical protein [Halobacillus amylolyticus]UOR10275.1 hypothetical protein MUO15_11150 [Halobacillus amylolyticus]
MSDEELLEKLLEFSDVLSTNNIFISGIRIVGWGIILFLKMIVDGLEGMVNNILSLTDFFMSEPVQGFLKTIQPVLYILLAISLAMIGFRLIFNKEKNRSDIPMNLFISIMTISLLTFGMGQVNEFAGDAVEVAQVETDSFTTSDKVMTDYITDITIYDETGWKTPDVKVQHHISPSSIDKISINETVDDSFEKANGDSLSPESQKIIMNKVGLESNGEEGLVSLGKDEWYDFLPENYYRWHVEWFTAIVTLGVMAFTMILISIKVAKLCFELGFNHIVALIMAYADISTGQRLKAVIKNIGSIFASIIMIFLSLRVYMYYTTFIGENLEGMGYLVALVAGSLAVIDGPNIVQKLFGIDAGLKNAWHVAMGGYLASKTVGPPAKKAAGAIVSGGTSAIMNTGAGTAGAIAGVTGGKMNGKRQRSESNQQTQKQEPSPMDPQQTDRPPQIAHSYDEREKNTLNSKGNSQPIKNKNNKGHPDSNDVSNSKKIPDARNEPNNSNGSPTPENPEDIPMPNQNRTEQRTMSQYIKDQANDRIRNNSRVQGTKRTYELSRNSTENWKNKMKKRGQGS